VGAWEPERPEESQEGHTYTGVGGSSLSYMRPIDRQSTAYLYVLHTVNLTMSIKHKKQIKINKSQVVTQRKINNLIIINHYYWLHWAAEWWGLGLGECGGRLEMSGGGANQCEGNGLVQMIICLEERESSKCSN